MIAQELIKAVTIASKSEKRSKQQAIGPSEIGGCRRQTWLRINGYEVTNPDTLRFPSMFGTAIHAYILEAFKQLDPFGERFLLEQEWAEEDYGLIGHVDCYDKENREVIDWKSTKKSNLRYFPSAQQRWQVQLYGYLLEKSGHKVDTVTLVAIPRDGDERDIVFHSEPYDIGIVNEALAWLIDIKTRKDMPSAEKDVTLCRHYCQFYDETGTRGCPSRPKAEAEGTLIDDALVDAAAKRYLDITQQVTELEQEKDSLKAYFEGTSGITRSGIKVLWSSVAGRKSVDEAAVKDALGYVPYKQGNPTARLAVKP